MSSSSGHPDLETVQSAVREFVVERDWVQFHSPASLARSISIESAELLECFQWDDTVDAERVVPELADVLTYCLLMADALGVDPLEAVMSKLDVTRSKYPVAESYGSSKKYDQR